MSLNWSLSVILGLVGLYLVKIYLWSNRGNRPPLPPGPKPKFLIGNLRDLPKPGELEWLHWLKHKDLYGPVSSVTIMGQTLIIINSSQSAFELMEKRSSRHSSRPKSTFAGEILGWENALGMLPYGDRFRVYRKQIAKVLGSIEAVSRFYPLQEVEVGHFLLRVLESPDDWAGHVRKEIGAVILKMSYGYTIEPHGPDPLVDLNRKALDQFGHAAIPGTWAVDMMPFLKYLPDWFQSTTFKHTARECRQTLTDLAERPYSFVKYQMAQGTNDISFVSALLESQKLNDEEKFAAKWSAMSLYAAGVDTTLAVLECFFLGMIAFPEIQRKAQAEIDQVIGAGRLPGFQDRRNLPYIDAVMKELLRWHPVAPMGLPHTTTEDDICDGYLIPKGALLLANIWYFAHDPEVYHEPMVFKPERFLSENGNIPEPDPHKLVFGFGRRICPGRLLADSTLYLAIAQTLAAFNVDKFVENGHELDPAVSFLSGVISHPVPFQTSIRPRSAQHEELIRSIEKVHPWQESDAKVLESDIY